MQKADAYLENLLLDAFTEISDLKVAEGCQDLGAGGILCATTEVIKRGRDRTDKNLGCNVHLENVSLKYDISDYSILASETQERMLLVSRPDNLKDLERILKKWDLEYNIIGEVTCNGFYNVYKNNHLIYYDNFTDLKEEGNNLKLTSSKSKYNINKVKDLSLWNSYDHSIGCRVIKGPDKPGHYSIIDIYENNTQCILTWGDSVCECNKRMVQLDARPLGIVNCLNFGDPKSCIGDFKESIETINAHCKELNIPVLGGNVSLYNSTDNQDIPPSIVILMIGIKK